MRSSKIEKNKFLGSNFGSMEHMSYDIFVLHTFIW